MGFEDRRLFKNRYGDTMSFEKLDDNKVFWYGSHNYERIIKSGDTITSVDPKGGPFISKGSCLGLFHSEFEDMIVDYFVVKDDGYIIICK